MAACLLQTSLAPFGFSYSNLAVPVVGGERIKKDKDIKVDGNKKLLSLSKLDTNLVIASKYDFENHKSTIVFGNKVEDINGSYSTAYNVSLPALYALTSTATNAQSKDLQTLMTIIKNRISPTELEQGNALVSKLQAVEQGIQKHIELKISLMQIQAQNDTSIKKIK